MKTSKLYAILGAGAVLGLVGCAKAPQAELDAAKAALDAATSSEANLYVAVKFNEAQDSLNAAKAEIEKQNAAFALTRSYEAAKKTIASATQLATEAQNQATAEKDKVKAEAEAMVTEVQTALTSAKDLLKKAPKGKEGKEALEAIGNELTAAETSVTEATTDLTNGQFLAAKDKLMASRDKIAQISTELSDAIAKTGKKK